MLFPRRFLTAGLALGLLATACGDDLAQPETTGSSSTGSGDTQTITVDSGEIVLTSGLATFDNCDALLTHLRTEGAERVGAYGFNDGGWWGPVERVFLDGEMIVEDAMEMEESAMDDSADASADVGNLAGSVPQAQTSSAEGGDGAVEGVDFSGTTNQEAGVDEPDIVKTDGSRIVTLTNGVLTLIDANDGDPVVRGTLNVGYEASEMLISGDRILLLGMSWGDGIGYPEPFIVDDIAVAESTDAEADLVDERVASDIAIDPGYYGPRVRIIEVDVSNPDSPSASNELLLDGNYLSARMVDGKARIAIQSNPTQLPFVYPQNQNGEERAAETNRAIVAETELADWIPNYTLLRNGEATTGQLSECTNVHAPDEFAGFGALSVVTVDMAEPLAAPDAAAVLAGGQTVYSSAETMWLGTNQWIDWNALSDEERVAHEQSYTTQLHGFSITGDQAEYLASGSVRGHMLNQFAMSEHEGVLRVATTDGPLWGANDGTESFVTTFEVDGRALRQIGQVGDLGHPGERIFSVRFVGDVAYIVTFRQTDPFYTVDLSDPANPTVLGELKITGYSGQLHPLGPDHVLGIGQEATEDGRTTGAKVTLFDVSDLANPVDLDTWTVPNTWTDAEWDHRAFLWWAPENLAVLPISNWQEQFWGAIAFRIDLDAGTISEAGRLSHEPDTTSAVGTTDCDVLDEGERTAMAAEIGEENELYWMLTEESEWIDGQGGQIQLCGDEERGATGLYCERWDWLETTADGVIEICWPEGPQGDPIVRTLVTGGDTLWSLSWTRLQANDLSSFEAGSWVDLG